MNVTLDEEIGRRLQQVRERQNLNQAQAVRALREVGLVWSQGTLSKVESGIRPIRLAELPSIARAFGVQQSELLAPEDPIASALQRMRVVESTAREGYHDLERRYLGAKTTRQSLQLLSELSENRPGPYTVSFSSARFLRDGLRDEFSETGIDPEEALASLGIEYVEAEDVRIGSEEAFEELKAMLPLDYQPVVPWKQFDDLRKVSEPRFNALNHARELLTHLAMGKALEAKYPQVTFLADAGPRQAPLEKDGLVITGLQEPANA